MGRAQKSRGSDPHVPLVTSFVTGLQATDAGKAGSHSSSNDGSYLQAGACCKPGLCDIEAALAEDVPLMPKSTGGTFGNPT